VSDAVNDIVLMAHPSATWHGAKELRTAADGFLLAVTRDSLLDACRRLRQEGYGDHVVCIIADANGIAPDIVGKIGNVLR
jgi:hypothetical protein